MMGATMQLLSKGTCCNSYKIALISHAISSAFAASIIHMLLKEDQKTKNNMKKQHIICS
jgi:hypothetical protein